MAGEVGAAADAVEEAAVEGAVAACGAVGFGVGGAVVVGGEARQAQGRVQRLSSDNCATGAGAEDSCSSAEAVPFDLLVFADGLHLVFHAVFVDFFRFGHFHLFA